MRLTVPLSFVLFDLACSWALPVTYGSVFQIEQAKHGARIFSTGKMNWGTSNQQVVTGAPSGSDEYDISSTYWQVVGKIADSAVGTKVFFSNADVTVNGTDFLTTKPAGEAVACNDVIRLMHVDSGKNLHSHKVQAMMSDAYEVSCFGDGYGNGDNGDNFRVECSEKTWNVGSPVKLKHVDLNGYLQCDDKSGKFTNRNCPGCAIVGHTEVSVSSRGKPNKSSVEWKAIAILHLGTDDFDIEDEAEGRDEL